MSGGGGGEGLPPHSGEREAIFEQTMCQCLYKFSVKRAQAPSLLLTPNPMEVVPYNYDRNAKSAE